MKGTIVFIIEFATEKAFYGKKRNGNKNQLLAASKLLKLIEKLKEILN